jgi:hypothetical protein
MHGDPHPRSVHRANPEGGLAVLTRQALAGPALARQAIVRHALSRRALTAPAPAGQHAQRPSARGRAWRSAAAHQHRRPGASAPAPRRPQRLVQSAMTGLGVLIIVSIVGLSGFFIVAEERRGHGGESTARDSAVPALGSRDSDPRPLTQREVFGDAEIRLAPGAAPYRVTMTHLDTDCAAATTGALGALLAGQGCAQVVRARLTAPYGGYQVTAGVFNLAREQDAALATEQAGPLVESGRGSFATLGGTASAIADGAQPLAQVGWHSRGHYLLYCVIARPDGQLVADDDPYAARITADLIERYLGEDVLDRRQTPPWLGP